MVNRVVLYSNCNCFYASVEMLHRLGLRDRPMAVGGDLEGSREILFTEDY